MRASPAWSSYETTVPESINSQLVGTFPALVHVADGNSGVDNNDSNTATTATATATACAFFVRAADRDFPRQSWNGPMRALVRPQFVKTPQGPIIVAYCMVSSLTSSSGNDEEERFVSETAIFPRLSTMPDHRAIADLLRSGGRVFYVICNQDGKCLFNSEARVMDDWTAELAEKFKGFDEGKQIADEKSAIMSLYWYQERYNPSSRIFEVQH